MSGIKVTAADRRFRQQIRERDKFTCRRCYIYYPPDRRQGLDTAHMFGRRCQRCTRTPKPTPHECTRLDPDNAMALCTGCHFQLDTHPEQKEAFWRSELGQVRFDALAARAHGKRDRTVA